MQWIPVASPFNYKPTTSVFCGFNTASIHNQKKILKIFQKKNKETTPLNYTFYIYL